MTNNTLSEWRWHYRTQLAEVGRDDERVRVLGLVASWWWADKTPVLEPGMLGVVYELDPDSDELIEAFASTIAKMIVDGLARPTPYFRKVIETMRIQREPPAVPPRTPDFRTVHARPWLTPEQIGDQPEVWLVRRYAVYDAGMGMGHTKAHAMFDFGDTLVAACGVDWRWEYDLIAPEDLDDDELTACGNCRRSLVRAGRLSLEDEPALTAWSRRHPQREAEDPARTDDGEHAS